MFDGCGDDVSIAAAECFGNSAHRLVVGFGASAGKNDLVRSRADELGHALAGSIHYSSRFLAERMQTGRIAKDIAQA